MRNRIWSKWKQESYWEINSGGDERIIIWRWNRIMVNQKDKRWSRSYFVVKMNEGTWAAGTTAGIAASIVEMVVIASSFSHQATTQPHDYNFTFSGNSGGTTISTSPDSSNPPRSGLYIWGFHVYNSQKATAGPNLGSGGICGFLSAERVFREEFQGDDFHPYSFFPRFFLPSYKCR